MADKAEHCMGASDMAPSACESILHWLGSPSFYGSWIVVRIRADFLLWYVSVEPPLNVTLSPRSSVAVLSRPIQRMMPVLAWSFLWGDFQ